ncbi:hypothetical protein CR513_23788, partial [Mucuna pruriens]
MRQDPPITFTNEDYEGRILHLDDPTVISVIIADYRVEWVLVDQGSSANVLFWLAFKKLGFSESSLEDCLGTLIGFAGEQVEIRGMISLETILGTGSTWKAIKMTFTVVNSPTSYNADRAKPAAGNIDNLVGVIRANQHVARRCYDESTRVLGGRQGRHIALDEQPQVHLVELNP